jgi:hypothetical protein
VQRANLAVLRFIWVAVAVFIATDAHADNILINPGFETGFLAPWFQNRNLCGGPCANWSVTSSDSHSGAFSAMDVGNIELKQNIAPTPTSQISQVSYWLKHPDGGTLPVDAIFFYSDGTVDEHGGEQFTTTANWTFFDWTSDLKPGKVLTGFSLFGFNGNPAPTQQTFVDDLTINVVSNNVVPEPGSFVLLTSGLSAFLILNHRRKRWLPRRPLDSEIRKQS